MGGAGGIGKGLEEKQSVIVNMSNCNTFTGFHHNTLVHEKDILRFAVRPIQRYRR